MKLCVFFERDGVLLTTPSTRGLPTTPLTLSEARLHRAALPLLHQLKEAGFALIATTNQPGISLGLQSRRELDRINDLVRETFGLDDIMVCPHAPEDHCPCHKPQPGMFIEAAYEHTLDLECSFVISDKWQDAEAARAVGCTSLLIQSPWIGSVHRDFLVPDLAAATGKILALQHANRFAYA